MSKFLLPLSDYNRIYQTAHGVLQDVANVERACIFFNSFGAYVLNKHYNIPARVVAGAFALCINNGPSVAFFGRQEEGAVVSDSRGFHMWIQTETHVVDFMAPIFPEVFAEKLPSTVAIPRKMLQKPLREQAASAADLSLTGDFIGYPDLALTQELVDNFFDRPANGDLLQIAEAWYGGRRAKQAATFAMINDLGEVTHLTQPRTVAIGAW